MTSPTYIPTQIFSASAKVTAPVSARANSGFAGDESALVLRCAP
jgi:hypothetical protein